MKDLSIVLRVKNKKLKTTVAELTPFFKRFSVELIIIAEKEPLPDIQQPYTLYPFSENSLNFSDFCMDTAVADKVLVIDGDFALSSEQTYKMISALVDSRFEDISCCIKSYLCRDKTLFFKHDEVLIYNRLVRGFHKNCGVTVEDYSFLDDTQSGAVSGIVKLCDSGRFRELGDWYQNFILAQPQDLQNQFYIALEKYKALHMDNSSAKKLDEIFADICPENEYGEYLRAKKIFINQKGCLPDSMKSKKAAIYYSWLLRRILKENQAESSHLFDCHESILRRELQYLLEEDESAPDYIYKYIVANGDSLSGNAVCLPCIYIGYMQSRSDCADDKKRLMNVCDLYMKNIVTKSNPGCGLAKREASFGCFLKIAEAVRLESLGQTKDAVQRLDHACARFPEYEKIIRYYIQKMRYCNQYHTHILSICLIVRNEEKNLDRCLKSLLPLISSGIAELIVTDTGSQDNTMKIAAKYTDKIYSFPWNGSFSEARNSGILHADGEYIMVMDADEKISPSELKKLKDLFSSQEYKQNMTFVISLKSYTNVSMTIYTVMAQPRIFKNNGEFYYSSSVHNQPVCSFPVKALDVEILHYGYIMTEDIRTKKFLRTSTMLKKELEKNPKNIYYRFQMSTSYAMYGDLQKALEQVEIYMRLIEGKNQLNDTVLMYYNNAAIIYMECHKYDECDKVCKQGLKICSDYIDLLYCEVIIHFVCEEYEESLSYAANYLKLADTFQNHAIARDGRFAFYSICNKENVKRLFIVSSYRLRHFNDVLSMASMLTDNKLLRSCLHEIVDAYLGTKRFSDLFGFYKSRVEKNEDPEISCIFRHFLIARLSDSTEKIQKECLSKFGPEFVEQYIPADLADSDYKLFSLDLMDRYNFDDVDYESLYPFLTDAVPVVLEFSAKECSDPAKLNQMKKLAAVILHRTKEILLSCLAPEDLVKIYGKYMEISSKLAGMGRMDLLEPREKLFITKMLAAFDRLKSGNARASAELMEDSAMCYYEMHDFIEFAMDSLISRTKVTAGGGTMKNCAESDAYCTDLKAAINKMEDSDSPQKILDIFAMHNRIEFYDAELTRVFSDALMSCGRSDDAQTVIASALKRFPGDGGLQKSLFNLALLKHDTIEAQQAYCRIKIGKPSDNGLRLLLPFVRQLPRADKKNVRVLHGTMDLSTRILELSKTLKHRGVFSRSLNYAPTKFKTRSYYELDVNRLENGSDIVNATTDIAAKLIPQFDVFNFHYGYTLTFSHNDLLALRDLGKKVFMNYWGQDVRMKSKRLCMRPEFMAGKNNDEQIARKLERISALVQHCIVCDEEIYEYVKDFFEYVHIIRPMIDLEQYRPVYRSGRKNALTIVHVISPADTKGSKYIAKAIEELKNNYSIDYRTVHGISHEKAMEIYKDADLIIDQVLCGSYGKLTVEAMALGKPVICGISDFMREKYPAELPVLSAGPNDIKQKIEYVLKNRDMLPLLGQKGRTYVEKYHDADKITGELVDLYKS